MMTTVIVTNTSSSDRITPANMMARTRGAISAVIVSTPRTWSASISSRTFRAPRSPAIWLALIATRIIYVSQVLISRSVPA